MTGRNVVVKQGGARLTLARRFLFGRAMVPARMSESLNIVWRQGGLIAVSKPSGVASQGGDGLAGNNLVDLARAHFKAKQVAVLHRLDRNVSGLVLLALDGNTARVMSEQLQAQSIERRYAAVVRGTPPSDAFEVSAWLAKDPKNNEVRAADEQELARMPAAQRELYKPAQTRFTVRERYSAPLGRCALLQVQLVTGRSHQIRAHCKHVGLPIVGDPKYGVAAMGVRRPLLHAEQLAFVTPGGERVELSDAPPWSMAELRGLRPQANRRR